MGDRCLLLDFGNSCLKARVDTAQAPGDTQRICYRDLGNAQENTPSAALQRLIEMLGPVDAEQGLEVRVSSVLSSTTNQALTEILGKNGLAKNGLGKVVWAEVLPECHSVCIAYAEPETLGVDRWLGLLGAYHRYQDAVMVVDAGSAITVDLVDAEGKHLGGVIVPGLQGMAQGLLGGTDLPGELLRDVQVALENGEPGTDVKDNTVAGISAGIQGSLIGLVELHFRQAIACFGTAPQIVWTGGDAQRIQSGLPDELAKISRFDRDLVLDGLLLI